MTTTALGSGFPTSTHRDTNKTYVSERSLDSLRKLGFSGDTLAVAQRGDSILDPQTSAPGQTATRDDILSLYELDRLDKTANNAALLPGERAALDTVHKLFEVPAEQAFTQAAMAGVQLSAATVIDRPAVNELAVGQLANTFASGHRYYSEQQAAGMVLAKLYGSNVPSVIKRTDLATATEAFITDAVTQPLSSFDAPTQTALQRLKQVRGDTSPNVTMAEIQWGQANTAPFTAETVASFNAVQSALYYRAAELRTLYQGILAKMPAEANHKEVKAVLNRNRADLVIDQAGVKVMINCYDGTQLYANQQVQNIQPAAIQRWVSATMPAGYKVFVKATANAGQQVSFQEAVLSPTTPASSPVNIDNRGNSSVWIQIFDAAGTMIANQRYKLPAIAAQAPQLGANVVAGDGIKTVVA